MTLICTSYLVLEPQDSGVFVVDEVVRRIGESGIFPDDKGLLRRIAWVESRFGLDAGTFHTGDTPVGIWKMDKEMLEKTKDVEKYPLLKEKQKKILEEFGINWNAVTMLDLHKPLIAGLAARLLLAISGETIPSKYMVREQAEYWKNFYNKDETTSSATFLKKLESIRTTFSQESVLCKRIDKKLSHNL